MKNMKLVNLKKVTLDKFTDAVSWVGDSHLGHLADAFIESHYQQVDLSEEGATIYRCRYIKHLPQQ